MEGLDKKALVLYAAFLGVVLYMDYQMVQKMEKEFQRKMKSIEAQFSEVLDRIPQPEPEKPSAAPTEKK